MTYNHVSYVSSSSSLIISHSSMITLTHTNRPIDSTLLFLLGLVTLIQKHNGGVLDDTAGAGGGGLSPQALVALLNSGGQRFSAGGSPNEPLFVATQEATWKTQAWRFVRNGVSLFLLLSFVGAIMDEKGSCGRMV